MQHISFRYPVAFCAALTLVALLLVMAPPSGPAPAHAGPFIQNKVLAALETKPTTNVLITLRDPAGAAGLSPASAAAQQVIKTQKDGVLAGVTASEFAPVREYDALPILAGELTKTGLAKLRSHPDVASVTVDGVGEIATDTSGPLIHAPEVHDVGFTGEGVVVAVLDTGADINHPDLADDIVFQACFARDCDELPDPGQDEHGHGTNVTGIITSKGTIAPLGIAPDADIAVYRVLSRSGFGSFSDWIAALNDIISNHPEVKVINMSLQSRNNCPSPALTTAISTLRDMGVATFIASGNHGVKDELTVPACVEEAISVGAVYDSNIGSVNGWKSECSDPTTDTDQVTCWSDSDDSLDLLAPGARETSTGLGGETITYMGTSQAAPHAVAVAAMLFQAFPDLSVDELETRMEATGKLLTDNLDDEDPETNRTTPRVDARVALLEPAGDYDGDGCGDTAELGDDPRLGGQRNPLNPWDFHDVNGDGVISLFDDVLAVINGFGTAGDDPLLDRSPAPPGSQPWMQGAPDGTIDLTNDILGVASQFGHTCLE